MEISKQEDIYIVYPSQLSWEFSMSPYSEIQAVKVVKVHGKERMLVDFSRD